MVCWEQDPSNGMELNKILYLKVDVAVARVFVVPVQLEVDALAQPGDAHHHEQLAEEDL